MSRAKKWQPKYFGGADLLQVSETRVAQAIYSTLMGKHSKHFGKGTGAGFGRREGAGRGAGSSSGSGKRSGVGQGCGSASGDRSFVEGFGFGAQEEITGAFRGCNEYQILAG